MKHMNCRLYSKCAPRDRRTTKFKLRRRNHSTESTCKMTTEQFSTCYGFQTNFLKEKYYH